nr:hypothetical protein BgiMline_007528 [Biomphalaria glabrata]
MNTRLLCIVTVLLLGNFQCSEGAPKLCANIVNCFVRPCQFAQCSVSGAVCMDDYCGGCNARWYVGNTEVTSQCAAIA